MLGIHRYLAVDGRCNAVDAEGLIVCRVVGLGFYNSLIPQFLEKRPVDRVPKDTFKGTVSLLCYLTGCAVTKNTDAESGKIHGIGFIQNRDHNVHHLGVTITVVIPPVTEMGLSPG